MSRNFLWISPRRYALQQKLTKPDRPRAPSQIFTVCLVFWKSEPQHTYKRYAYKKIVSHLQWTSCCGSKNAQPLCHLLYVYSNEELEESYYYHIAIFQEILSWS